jgi:hypothetical protein
LDLDIKEPKRSSIATMDSDFQDGQEGQNGQENDVSKFPFLIQETTSVLSQEELESISKLLYLLPVQPLHPQKRRKRKSRWDDDGTRKNTDEEIETNGGCDSFHIVLLENEEMDYVDIMNCSEVEGGEGETLILHEVVLSEDVEVSEGKDSVQASNHQEPFTQERFSVLSTNGEGGFSADLDLGAEETIDSGLEEKQKQKKKENRRSEFRKK